MDFSTAGTDESVYLRRWVELGRAFTAERLCYIEYSAGDGDDPADPATWARCTPALGVTIQPETIADEYATSLLGSFERYALNRWTHGVDTRFRRHGGRRAPIPTPHHHHESAA